MSASVRRTGRLDPLSADEKAFTTPGEETRALPAEIAEIVHRRKKSPPHQDDPNDSIPVPSRKMCRSG
jgi:hypothetical protein